VGWWSDRRRTREQGERDDVAGGEDREGDPVAASGVGNAVKLTVATTLS
jgi:hypothetical protein